MSIFMKVTGTTQGAIEGGCIIKGYEGYSHVIEFNFPIEGFRDAASGHATGKRVLGPWNVVKPMDKSTPLLMTAISNNEMLSKVEIKIHQPDPVTKKNVLAYVVTMEEVHIGRYESHGTSPVGAVAGSLTESISFHANKFTLDETVRNITWHDDWRDAMTAAG